jgi:LPXTG-motif cell wall-anchored protein
MKMTTNSEGVAMFGNLKPGEYSFEEVLQAGWIQTAKYCAVEEYDRELSRNTVLNGDTHDDENIWVESGETVECYIGNYKTPVPEVPVTPPAVLGATTSVASTPVVLATTGDNQGSYAIVTGLTLIAATLLTAINRKKDTVTAK